MGCDMHRYIEAHNKHRDAAQAAYDLFIKHCGRRMPRVPGMDTVIRLAWRIECGRSIEEAAGREYLYRWHIVFNSSSQNADRVFGVPHTLGM